MRDSSETVGRLSSNHDSGSRALGEGAKLREENAYLERAATVKAWDIAAKYYECQREALL